MTVSQLKYNFDKFGLFPMDILRIFVDRQMEKYSPLLKYPLLADFIFLTITVRHILNFSKLNNDRRNSGGMLRQKETMRRKIYVSP